MTLTNAVVPFFIEASIALEFTRGWLTIALGVALRTEQVLEILGLQAADTGRHRQVDEPKTLEVKNANH